jgi:hypothetical protein
MACLQPQRSEEPIVKKFPRLADVFVDRYVRASNIILLLE